MQNLPETLYNSFWITIYLLVLAGFIFGSFMSFASWKRRQREKIDKFKLTFLLIKLPPQNEFEVKAAEQMFDSLMGFRKSWWQALFTGQYRISFEIVAKSAGIGFYVVVPNEIAGLVEKAINGAYPSAEIDLVNPTEIWDRGAFTSVAELRLKGPSFYPIKVYEDVKGDSISTITSSMSKLQDDEVIAIQYVLRPSSDSWRHAGQGFMARIRNAGNNPDKKVTVDTSFLEGIEKKIAKPGFDCSIRFVSIAKDKFAAEGHIRNAIASFEQFTDVRYNRFKKRSFISTLKLANEFIYRKMRVIDIHIPFIDVQLYRNTSVLNTTEMATIFHFPNKDVQTPGIIWLGARKAAAPTNLPDTGQLYLGKSVFRGVEKKVFMLDKDRTRHFYIIGQTGTGKSEFMKSLALQDIAHGEGLAFIDPHGSDIDDILQKIPENRMDDVILWDVSDVERPMGLNMLEAKSDDEKHMLINAFIALLYKLYDPNHQGIMGPMLERAIRNVMLTAMCDPESTMVDVLRLLIDSKYIQKYLPLIQDPLVKRYWTDEVAKTPENRKNENMGYFVSKFDRFITDITMRNIVGQPKSAFNFHDLMSQKKILLVDLSKGKIGEENSNFLGLLLVPRILAAALGRASLLGKEEFPNFYLYVDEFQNFATDDFATILSEARKYKLNLVVAHQFVAQLEDKIKEAVFGNVGTITAFRVGADDAEYLETQFKPTFEQNDLINNPNGNAYIKLLVNGHPTVPFSLTVDWDMITKTQKNPDIARRIRENSRNKYGIPAKEVEEFINFRAGNQEPELPKIAGLDKDTIPF